MDYINYWGGGVDKYTSWIFRIYGSSHFLHQKVQLKKLIFSNAWHAFYFGLTGALNVRMTSTLFLLLIALFLIIYSGPNLLLQFHH